MCGNCRPTGKRKGRMNKEVACKKCNGTGKETVQTCDGCGKETRCGEYEGQWICVDCWAKSLSPEEINNL